ncbi:MAG: DDE-type integrase/transposase/recombinase [Pelatocladus maniniholoensis HA4357-MV3]|jgi:putative transposase|uniref:DDE-type integrase/transposase/recombinase n=1 Tax=Pelatocladus maniniholoensis HA4357-MV3 TaxID=1117104 RepID=A0A9E3H4X6_9NOST|nr:DDE-type integrase/transposase/recombinase [Pelatocladus maniniholoensis HA4357-MV3]MBW4430952.1 DDE-type integrase/transposase/recombinase [Pelatocladus maniniholoensis HA4357-MV3]
MNHATEPALGWDASNKTTQLALRQPALDTDEQWELVDGGSELPDYVQQRMRVIQQLLAARGTKTYAQVQRQAAHSLGISVRSLRRLLKAWQESGVAGLSRQPRSDQGSLKTSQEWQDYIVKTYKDGNRGSRQISPAQVAVQVRARAQALGIEDYPGRTTVYRILRLHICKQQQKRSLGWRQDRLTLHTREGLAIAIEWSNQVWQVDHTRADVLVVDQSGEVLGRPWLTIVVDTYSRCIMGFHLGFDAPSAAVVCLALRHAILPKQYSSAYELHACWGTYGLPQYLYTDGGKDFRSRHLEQVATELGIVLCLRRKPSDGGIVERPFGTFNSQFFSTLPGYVNSNVTERSPVAESEACLTLLQLERLLVRYIVDHYNQAIDARMGDQSRIGRWEAGRIAQLPLLGNRELDLCLMRRDRRTVYRSGYLQFANLTYQGEHLAAYAGESVIVRYDPRDITTVFIYEVKESLEVFLTRAHAVGWETETLSYAEAVALSQHKRQAGKAISNRSMLDEVRDRDQRIKKLQKHPKQNGNALKPFSAAQPDIALNDALVVSPPLSDVPANDPTAQPEPESHKPKKPVPYVRVYDYEDLKREAGLL